MATYMLAHGTIDEEIYELIESKRGIVNAATEGVELDMTMSAEQIIMDLLSEGLGGTNA